VQADPIPARAETNSTGSPPLVCSEKGHSEILSNWYLEKRPSRDHESGVDDAALRVAKLREGIRQENRRCEIGAADLRRTCARLCHASGGELEQIQFLLGLVSVQTTERYLGCKQRIRSAVNDRIGIEPNA